MAACSFQSASTWTRPCCINTRMKWLPGLNVSRVKSPVMVPVRNPSSVNALPPPAMMLSPSAGGCENDAGVHRSRDVLIEPDAQVRLALRLVQIVEGAHLGEVLGAPPDLVRRAQRQLGVVGRPVAVTVELGTHAQPFALANCLFLRRGNRSTGDRLGDGPLDEVGLAFVPARRPRARHDGAEPDATALPAGHLDQAGQDAVLGELEGMNLQPSEDRGSPQGEDNLGNGPFWRPHRHPLRAGGIQDAVVDDDLDRVVAGQPRIDLDGADDAVLDIDPCARAIELETRLRRPHRLAVVPQGPARGPGAVPEGQLRGITLDTGRAARDQPALQD